MAIKYRDGWTPTGLHAANRLQQDGLEISQRVRGNTIARRLGDFTTVRQGEQILDGIYSLGLIDGAYKIVGSVTGRGTFSKLGDAGTGSWAVVPALAFYGRGKGMVPFIQNSGFILNFDAKACLVVHVDYSTTPNGRQMTPHYDYYFAAAPGEPGATTYFHNGYYWDDAGTRTFAVGYSGLAVSDDGQHRSFFIYETDAGRSLGATISLVNQIAIEPKVVAAGPGRFLMLHRYFRPSYDDSIVDVGSTPGTFRSYSVDGGQTWTFSSSGDMFDDFDSVNTLVPTDYHYGDLYNSAVLLLDLQMVMIKGTLGFAVAQVPYCVMVDDQPTIRVKMKYGLCDTAANFLLSSTGTIFDGDPVDAPVVQIFGVEGGAVMLTTYRSAGLWTQAGQIQFTPDGVAFSAGTAMPFAGCSTGVISAFDKLAIVCPMYDGEAHALYESKDLGVSWTKRATIYEGAPAPDAGDPVLQRFGAVTCLRRDNLPTVQTPATPWATDSRYPAPI